MLKKIYLSAAFTFLSCTPMAHASTDINTVIATAIKDIMMEAKTAFMLMEKAEKHFQNILQDAYATKKEQCLAVLKIIAESPEFISTLEQVTDEQVRLITQDMVAYNDIVVDPTAFPLQKKVETELSLAAFDAQQEELFNIFYVVFAIISGSKMLTNKLNSDLEALNATDHVSQS
jgi:hypothetical protein